MVAASIARSLMPAQDSCPAPPWLLPEQRLSFHRSIAAIRRFQGALLADPVGSGKTYVALAVATTLNAGRATGCLVPATLLDQWAATANRLQVPLELCSHQQASLGRLPGSSGDMVIIDESHHFRNHLTKRYTHVARWLVSRRALLLTATPIVNRLSDLAHQLLLAVRDNALAIDGISSLRELLGNGQAHPALGHLVVENDGASGFRPRRNVRVRVPAASECMAVNEALALVSRLRLSRSEAVARLIRGILLRAASSSPGALAGSLRRYRRLLMHARDAQQAGRSMQRSQLRRFTAELGDQLVWWELLPVERGSSDLELGDLSILEEIIPAANASLQAPDGKLERLRDILADERPTLVFTTNRDTVRYIRQRLRRLCLAWCTGEEAGVGPASLPRRIVLRWFKEEVGACHGPRHLIVTDVAAEGLDLQRAAQVVHYDLPWTPMKLEQREGRSVRLGSPHSVVEVLRFAPPPELDCFVPLEATLARKAKLPGLAGLGAEGRHVWRWRSEVARDLGASTGIAGTARVPSTHRGVLVGLSLYQATNTAGCLSSSAGWLDRNGVWTEDADVVTDRLRAASEDVLKEVPPQECRMYLELLTPLLRRRLTLSHGGRWVGPQPSAATRAAALRLGELIRQAARLRHDDRLSQLERAMAFVGGGHTAGEEMMLERMAGASDGELAYELSRRLPQPDWNGLEVRLTGFIVFGPEK
jgi:superfamily II DNA or RNA helicase